ncbi:ACP S-malonyltransferase [Ramlibacter sp. AW1]|uniref:Malonyl CoA-acyl carrier protein transacylase n=1 Tax=Ramlibacter aurantiacus TaxID=2801330 RepID=A0A936ZSY0_9BURK|nr:ACP S-malonyltransferase [Ramlibacter aurantiacus]MBL0423121.1 ACP S-malonyltransferase [Ramlibacter aurantiacus]
MKPFAFVFPGQGSQSVGMLDAWGDHPAVRQVLQEASDALGQDLARLIHEGPKEDLALTANTQPAMLVAGVAAWRAWQAEGGPMPAVMAGHSLGEYSALVAAGALSLADAAPLVRFRAQAMQEAVPVGAGAMAAILGMEAERVIQGCAEAGASFPADAREVVEAVNFNDPAQTVIAGTRAGVDKACELLKAQGAKRALPLPVSAPFHSSLMKPAADRLREKLAATAIRPPAIPVLNNIDVEAQSNPDRIRDALYRQAFGPVRWVQCMRAVQALGISTVVECGPGKVLAGLCKRIDPSLTGLALHDPTTLADLKGSLQ